MNQELFVTLAVTAATVGAAHTVAPDHWLPFAALARARGWSAGKTARVTIFCGFGHVTASVLLGLLGLLIGVEVLQALGQRLESVATIVLIAFGVLYATWGIRRLVGARLHGHSHSHYDHVHDLSGTTEWTLFLIFSADPCIAVIPIMLAAVPLGPMGIAGVALVYELATVATMVVLVLPARYGVELVRGRWLDQYGHVFAGLFIAAVGVAMLALGL